MPLRKQGNIIATTAVIAAGFAGALPSSASALSLFGSTTTTTSTAPAVVHNLAADGASCVPMPVDKKFAKWNDAADYYPAPGGTFESGSLAWKLTSGAKIVSGNENLGVSAGAKALELPTGATATSPEFCVDDTQPSFRFTAKLSSLDGGYAAIVIYKDAAGQTVQSQFLSSNDGTFYNGATAWNPSKISPLASNIPLVQGGGKVASVKLMFVGTTKAYGMWVASKATIDSVMVDPYRRG